MRLKSLFTISMDITKDTTLDMSLDVVDHGDKGWCLFPNFEDRLLAIGLINHCLAFLQSYTLVDYLHGYFVPFVCYTNLDIDARISNDHSEKSLTRAGCKRTL